jgi:hypothetical protein
VALTSTNPCRMRQGDPAIDIHLGPIATGIGPGMRDVLTRSRLRRHDDQEASSRPIDSCLLPRASRSPRRNGPRCCCGRTNASRVVEAGAPLSRIRASRRREVAGRKSVRAGAAECWQVVFVEELGGQSVAAGGVEPGVELPVPCALIAGLQGGARGRTCRVEAGGADATVAGAAALAAVGARVTGSLEEAAELLPVDRSMEPHRDSGWRPPSTSAGGRSSWRLWDCRCRQKALLMNSSVGLGFGKVVGLPGFARVNSGRKTLPWASSPW